MASNDASVGESQPLSQLPYGTQMLHPLSARPSEEGPQLLVVNRAEPTLAGNTQREETRPNAFTPNQLLSLLHPILPTTTLPAPKANERDTFKKPRPPVAPSATESPLSQLPDIVNRRPTQRENEVAPEAPSSSRSTSAKLAKRQDIGSQSPRSTAAKSSHAELKGKGKQEDKLQQLVAECSWMKGFEFSRDAFRVPYSQRRLLDNENSWYKPQVGCLFPPDNIPIDVLDPLYKRADQQAAMDAAPDSDDEMEEDPSPESVDPSPESLVESVDPSPDSVPQPTQDDIQPPSSVRSVSWSQSPEPPVLSKRPDQGLPPDSSLANQENNHTDGIRRGSMGHDTRPPQLIVIESSDEEPTAPPSSPPAIEQAVDFDDEDMEESVPQGYGEDSTEGAVEPQARRSESASPHPKSVVQVRETPYARGKIAQLVAETASPRARKESSSGTSKHTSSTSIIYGTYNEATSAGPTQDQPLPKGTMDVFSTNGEMSSSDLMEAGAQVLEFKEQQLREQQLRDLRTSTEHTRQDHALDVVMADAPADRQPRAASPTQEYERASEDVVAAVADNNDARSIQPDQNPIVAQLPLRAMNSLDIPASSPETRSNRQDSVKSATLANSPSLPPGSTKRKSTSSPSRKNKRQSRRREIKLVGFGKDAPFPTDPASNLRQDREDLKLVASHESRTASATATGERHNEGIMEIDPPAAQANIPAMSHQSIKDEAGLADEAQFSEPAAHLTSKGCLPDQRSPIVTTPTRPFPTVQIEKQVEPSTSTENLEYPIFKKFQATYPDYKGDVIHFKNQVEEMISLDKEDKMVPKWRWDDYIIRHTIDYRTSMLARMVNGQKPEPDYHRFYKDTIQDTLYKKGVLVNRTTLEQAWEELGSVTLMPVPVSRPVEQVHGQQALEQKRPEQQRPERQRPDQQRPEQQRPERRRPERPHPEQPRSEPRSEQPLFEPSRPKQPRPKQPRPGRQQQPTQSARKETQSRRSLPSAFNEHKSTNQTPINVSRQHRPRQSLPVKSQINHRTPNNQPSTTRTRTSTPSVLKNAPSTAIPSFLTRLKLDDYESPRTSASGASTEGTGDPFKDIVFAHQRLKAFTGSTKVDTRLPWPENIAGRLTVAELLPKRKINVLKWKDEL